LAAIASILGRLPSPDEYRQYVSEVDSTAADTYRYLNFNELPEFVEKADSVEISAEMKAAAHKLQTRE
jgi:aconitate hydratase 2/2-methylisocitrate dehydratase